MVPTKNRRKGKRERKGGRREEQLLGEMVESRTTSENVQDVPGTPFGLMKKRTLVVSERK